MEDEIQFDYVEMMTSPMSNRAWKALRAIYRQRCLVCRVQHYTRLIPVKVHREGLPDVTNIEPRCAACRDVEGDHRDGAETIFDEGENIKTT